jgi:hypothetical protein
LQKCRESDPKRLLRLIFAGSKDADTEAYKKEATGK